MAGKASKVKFNIKNVHFATKDVDESGAVTYGAPFALPGAVSISLEAQGELSPFYADGVKYYVSSSNAGYEGDLEVALITDEVRQKILGETMDTNKVLIENSNAQTMEFALGFDIDGDQKSTRFWFYNCTATRPTTESSTTEDTKEPTTDTITISCASSMDGKVRAKTTAEVQDSIFDDWYKAVYTGEAQAPETPAK